jgi:zinc finger HIT domain-containing protein 1
MQRKSSRSSSSSSSSTSAKRNEDAISARQANRLLLLEKDNAKDDEVDTTTATATPSRKKRKLTFVKRNLARVFALEVNKQQHDGYIAATSEKSNFPARHFCSICGYHSDYVCTKCEQRYCSVTCYATHEDTRCLKHK